jgi:hypothetical protein
MHYFTVLQKHIHNTGFWRDTVSWGIDDFDDQQFIQAEYEYITFSRVVGT